MLETSYHYLITCGVHVGHSILNSHRLCGWMVLAQRQKILLIDLSKFLYMFSQGIRCLQNAVSRRQPVWFISLDPMYASIIRKASQWCGEYHVSTYWIGGLLTNFLEVARTSWWRYTYLSPLVHSAKQRLRREIYEEWSLTRLTWPRVTFLCGVRQSYRAAKEALRAHIPCIGIADTATSAQALSIAVPGNDESLESIYFYNCLVAQTILLKKFSQVFSWANSVRKTSRFGSFHRWFAFRNSSRLAKAASPFFKKPSFSSAWSGYGYWTSSHSSLAMSGALMYRLLQHRLAVPRNQPPGKEEFLAQPEEVEGPSWLPLSAPQVRGFFLENQARFNGLIGLRSLASVRRIMLRRNIERRFSYFSQKRPIYYSGRKETFTFRHLYLDLMAPSPLSLDKDFVYKRGIGSKRLEMAFLKYRNAPFQEIFFRLVSTLFLLYSYYQRGPLQSPSAAVNAATYFWHGPYRRRVHRENSRVPRFFRDVLHAFLVRTLHLTRTVSRSYRLPFLPVFRGRPKLPRRIVAMPGQRRARSPKPKRRAASPKRGLNFPSAFTIASLGLRFKRVKALRPSLWLLLRRYRRSPAYLRELARREAKRQRPTFPKLSHLSPRAFSFFTLNKWRFHGGFLPEPYWQFRLLYLPGKADHLSLAVSKAFHRPWLQRRVQSYPLFRRSLLWIRKGSLGKAWPPRSSKKDPSA